MSKLGHYTSQKGFLGMASEEKLWATNIKFLNDEQEFQHAIKLIHDIIPKASITESSTNYNAYKKYIESLRGTLESLDSFKTESIYTFSVSEELDLLSQWRGYCPDNNGYCITLDIEGVFNDIKKIHPNSYLVKCVYEQGQKEIELKKILNEHWQKYCELTSNQERTTIVENLAAEIALLASHLKHSSFSEENEWRIIIILGDAAAEDIKFRDGRTSLIPYLELPLKWQHINEVKIGPTSNKLLSKKAMSLFLERKVGNIFTMPNISHSETPYRQW
jgi:hypothetical protein